MRPPVRRPRSTTAGVRRSGLRGFSCEPLAIREPELHQRTDRILDACLVGGLEGLLVALSHLDRVAPLLQAVVAGHEELLDPFTGVVPLHKPTLTSHISPGSGGFWRPSSTSRTRSAC